MIEQKNIQKYEGEMSSSVGDRVCIVGLSACGKSTLAKKIAEKKKMELLHLDQIYFVPNTQWEPAAIEDFYKEHDLFIQKEKWVIDGSYSKCMAQRLKRADTLIILQFGRWSALWRFIKRAVLRGERVGVPEGTKEQITLDMILFILKNPKGRYAKIEQIAAENPHLNVIRLSSFKEIDRLVERL